MWATWKAHSVMASYLKSRFYEHHSLTAVISWHLADNYVKPDDLLSSKVAAFEKQSNKVSKSIIQLETSNKDHDKALSGLDRGMKGIQAKLDKIDHKQQKNGGRPGETTENWLKYPGAHLVSQNRRQEERRTHPITPPCMTDILYGPPCSASCIIIADGWPSWLTVCTARQLACNYRRNYRSNYLT
jgi:hypothetical protein